MGMETHEGYFLFVLTYGRAVRAGGCATATMQMLISPNMLQCFCSALHQQSPEGMKSVCLSASVSLF